MVEVFPFTNVFIYENHSSLEEYMSNRGSDEWKSRISETKKRQYAEGKLTPWNKGLPKEQQPFYGKKHTQETKDKISKKRLGKPHPHKGYVISQEARRKMSIAKKGKKLSEEHRAKIAARIRANPPRKGAKLSDETKKKIGDANRGRKHSEETKQKLRITSRRARLNRENFPARNTSIERALHEKLDSKGYEYKKHLTVCDICQPDIVFHDLKIAIFADGDYWHSKEFKNGKAWKKDRNQDRVLSEGGWVVLRFWGSEIKEDVNSCIEKIENTIIQRGETNEA